MLPLAITLAALSGIAALVWTTRHIKLSRERAHGFWLTPDRPGPPTDAPRISVIVAAKDEQENIEACVRTMLDQDYPNFEMIACNDRSDDATGDILARVAAEDDRLTAVNVRSLPDGWCGKNNAMREGVSRASGDWLCMIDADCRQLSRRTLSTAMQHALDTKADLLSVLPTLEMKGFWENVVQPVCGGVMLIWFDKDKVNSPHRRHAYANGAFMLIRREAYEAVGGHEAVKDQVNEDMHMAAAVKKAGMNLRVVPNRGLYLTRMYTSLGQIVRGWSRIFFGTFGTLGKLVTSFMLLLVMGLVPYAAAGLGLGLHAAGGGAAWLAAGVLGAAAAGLQMTVMLRYYRLIQGKPALAWTYPLGCAVAMLAVVKAIGKLRAGSKVTWRNTTYTRPS